MLTIFACPKPFTDPHIALIQRNAIQSWTRLNPKPSIILVGDEPGVAEICREFGLDHLREVSRNEFGTPVIDDVFRRAESRARHPFLCYVNADIILMSDFQRAVETAARSHKRFMMGGRPWDVHVNQDLAFRNGWEEELHDLASSRGTLRNDASCDYFVYTAGLWGELPPFALGRCYFDNALMRLARRRGGALIDATEGATAIHQHHGYPPGLQGRAQTENVEAQRNIALAGGAFGKLTWKSATHVLRADGIRRRISGSLYLWHVYLCLLPHWRRAFWHPFLQFTRPARQRLGLRKTNASRGA